MLPIVSHQRNTNDVTLESLIPSAGLRMASSPGRDHTHVVHYLLHTWTLVIVLSARCFPGLCYEHTLTECVGSPPFTLYLNRRFGPALGSVLLRMLLN